MVSPKDRETELNKDFDLEIDRKSTKHGKSTEQPSCKKHSVFSIVSSIENTGELYQGVVYSTNFPMKAL